MREKSLSAPWRFNCDSQSANTSATSRADGKRASGSFACSLATTRQSHSGTSGITSRIGRGSSSATRFRTASAEAARNGGRPVHIT